MPQARENAMTIDQVDQKTVTTEGPTATGQETVQTERRHSTTTGPGGAEMARRIVVLVFGLIQILIGARILLLLLDAREANGLVSAILDSSQVLVAPFEGILRTDALNASGSVLDLTAIVALVGWTVVELIALWVIGIFGRRSAADIA
jgi:hypothetical protein